MSKPTRQYTNGTITVDWYPELCIHCGECVAGLPEVFDLNKKPWVNLSGATDDEIVKQVEKCPSGALSL
jgi:putative redox protein